MNPDAQVIDRRYELQAKLGAGGMGAVYRAYDRLTQQQIALKRVMVSQNNLQFASKAADKNLRLSLAREFKTLAGLRHPHIISVLDYGFDEQRQPYFTMQLLDEADNLRKAAHRLSFVDKIKLVVQLLQALIYLHQRGILHRDLKPGNVLVHQQHVSVLDFGIALEVHHAQQGQFTGTLAYAAPELIQLQPPSPQSDLYAVGMMLYEILLGAHPFNTTDMAGLIADTLKKPVLLDDTELPDSLKFVLVRLLSKDPADRYTTAVDTLRALCMATDLPLPPETAEIRESFLQTARFVGREREFSLLRDALNATRQRQGSLWLVGGESGVGKSRLLDELRTHALVRGAQVLRGQAVAGGGLPYQVWRDVMRRMVLFADIDADEAAILKSIIPDIAVLLGHDVPDAPMLEANQEKRRLMATITAIFGRQTRPTVLLLEDLHWAIESFDVLKSLIGVVDTAPLLIIGSYRDDEKRDLPSQIPQARVLPLHRLDHAAITRLSESILGDAGREQPVLELIQRETEGNVFFIIEVMRALAEEAGEVRQIGRMTLPPSIFAGGVQQVIQRRLQRVPQSAQPLLRLTALAGREIDVHILPHLANDMAQHQIDAWLRTCNDVAVLEINDGKWRFSHDKIRQAVIDTIDQQELPTLYRQVAQAMEAAYAHQPEQAMMLMQYWQMAGDEPKEFHYGELVVQQVRDLGNFRQVIDTGERVLSIAPQDIEPLRLIVLRRLLASAYMYVGDLDAVMQYIETAKTQADAHGYPLEKARIIRVQARALINVGDYPQARDLLEQSLATAQSEDEMRLVADCEKDIGFLDEIGGEFATAQERYHKSLAIYRQSGDKLGEASALNDLGIVASITGDFANARTLYEQSLAIKKETGDIHGTAATLNNLGLLLKDTGDLETAWQYHSDVLKIRHQIGDQVGIAASYNNLADVARVQGNLQEALTLQNRSIPLKRRLNDWFGLADSFAGRALIYQSLKQFAEAHADFIESLSLKQQINDARGIQTALSGLTNLLFDMQQYDRALLVARVALAQAHAISLVQQVANLLIIIAQLQMRTGMQTQAALVTATIQQWQTHATALFDQPDLSLEALSQDIDTYLTPALLQTAQANLPTQFDQTQIDALVQRLIADIDIDHAVADILGGYTASMQPDNPS